jgi:tRNA (cmo5U34)-methyltransferase
VKEPAPGPKDTLFQHEVRPEDFEFNDRVVEVFDDMLDRSIPSYREVIVSTSHLLNAFLHPGDTVYDLGCSTGSTLLELSRLLPDKSLHFIGVDNSAPMLDKARLKAELFSKQDAIAFRQADITATDYPRPGPHPHYTRSHQADPPEVSSTGSLPALPPRRVVILSEKIIFHDRRRTGNISASINSSRRTGPFGMEIAKSARP